MRRALALLLFALVIVGGALTVPTARSASPDVVVSQVFAGGGNAGAPFTNDFVELFNRGSAAVDVGGWTIQYASAAGASWQATALSGSIAPGRHYLVQLASGAVGGSLPTPDASGTTNLAVSGGKVAVVRSATLLACGASAGSCAGAASLADLIGYGGAADYEGGAAAGAIDNTTAATRAADGCADTDDNSADFSAAAPVPRNTASAATRVRHERAERAASRRARRSTSTSRPSSRSPSSGRRVSFGNATTGSTPAPVSENGDGGEQRQRRLLAHRSSRGVRSRRSAARDRRHRPEWRPDRRRTRGGRDGSDSDRPGGRPARRHDVRGERAAPATCGTRDSASSRRSRLCRRVTTRPPSRSR